MTKSLLDILTVDRELPSGFDSWGMKTVDSLRRTKNKFLWPDIGGTVKSWDDSYVHYPDSACPVAPGDGLTVALTCAGMTSSGLPMHSVLLVAFRSEEVVAGTSTRIRTSGDVMVVDEWHVREIDLTDVDLTGAYLIYADLSEANLTSADLTDANLTGAYLPEANLTGAYLPEANLIRADLTHTNLTHTNLTGADLSRADLTGAILTGAILTGAILTNAVLTDADLPA